MAGHLHHEEIYRGQEQVAKLAEVRLVLCGAGALGSHLAENLVRQGFRQLRIIDRDRVEQHNISTQIYDAADVGAWKVDILRNRLFRAAGVEVEAQPKELNERTVRGFLKGSNVVLDTFDNSVSRRLVQEHCRARGLTCLHVGLNADYGEVIWDEHYRVPADVAGDVCDYPLARNLILLTVAIASETLVSHVLSGARGNWSVTLGDFSVRPFESDARCHDQELGS